MRGFRARQAPGRGCKSRPVLFPSAPHPPFLLSPFCLLNLCLHVSSLLSLPHKCLHLPLTCWPPGQSAKARRYPAHAGSGCRLLLFQVAHGEQSRQPVMGPASQHDRRPEKGERVDPGGFLAGGCMQTRRHRQKGYKLRVPRRCSLWGGSGQILSSQLSLVSVSGICD